MPGQISGPRIALIVHSKRPPISALQEAGGNKSRAAEMLGLSRFALQRKLEKYALIEEEAG